MSDCGVDEPTDIGTTKPPARSFMLGSWLLTQQSSAVNELLGAMGSPCVQRAFKDISGLKEHLKRHHSRRFNCPDCGERIKSEEQQSCFTKEDEPCTDGTKPGFHPPIMTWEQDDSFTRVDFRKARQNHCNFIVQYLAICQALWPGHDIPGSMYKHQILARYQPPAPETPMAGLRAPDGDNDRHGTLGDSRGSTSSMESLDFFSIPKPTNEELIKLVPRKDSGYYGSETHSDKTGRGTSGMTGQNFGSSTKNLSVAVTVGGAGGDGQPLELASAEQFFHDAFWDEDYQWENGWL
ncbi:hypothetical protein BJF96_g5458 [Verticillium dahliae]|uniref:Uncharacterized protein n=1 Tax=Verticillium dahliae TaxID=27337 RepID=A0AA44WHW0_VERDA|nr:hypothetical protein BJF96_g5458 [Verticillium dahliae]